MPQRSVDGLTFCALLLSCATTPPTLEGRLSGLEHEAHRCGSYRAFHLDAANAEQVVELSAAGEALMNAAQRVSAARRQCATRVLAALADSGAGSSEFQRELDLMAKDYSAKALRRLVANAVGSRADELQTLITLAVSSVESERAATQAMAAPMTAAAPSRVDPLHPGLPLELPPGTTAKHCAETPPLAALECLRLLPDEPETTAAADAVASNAELLIEKVPLERRAEAAASVATAALRLVSPTTQQRLDAKLEALCRARWPLILELTRSEQPLRAATLAAPCRRVAALANQTRHLTRSAAADEEARAKKLADDGYSWAALLHRSMAAALTAQTPPKPPLSPGRWDLAHFSCAPTDVSLPTVLPLGLTLRVVARCETREATTHDALADSEEHIKGDLIAACGANIRRWPWETTGSVMALPNGGSERLVKQALEPKLSNLAREASTWCTTVPREARTEACARAANAWGVEVEQRFTEWAMRASKWEPCFSDAFLRAYGTQPPALAWAEDHASLK